MNFIHDDFLLRTRTAARLYHQFAEDQPILDYHCHLSPRDIAENRQFKNLFEIWLEGDHYKWRAMRANGVPERFCTGDATPFEKFKAWAATVPHTLRNPLYHWTHLELKRYFGVSGKLLNPETAKDIYETCSRMLQTSDFSTRSILQRMNVRVVCTTDDPTDSLEHHLKLKTERGFAVKVRPAFRPDKALGVESPRDFNK
jgi:glucuronate isomerase